MKYGYVWATWSFNLKGVNYYKTGKVDERRSDKYDFATFKLGKDGKILRFFNIFVDDDALALAKKDPLFAEVCHFETHTQRSEKDIRDKNFDGSIYDALVWVKEEHDKINRKRLTS